LETPIVCRKANLAPVRQVFDYHRFHLDFPSAAV